MSKNIFNNTLVIGLGLIGGSFAKSIKKNNLSNKIFAFDIEEESINQALEQQIIDGFTSLDSDLNGFDLIVIASPLSSYKEILEKIARTSFSSATIIDLGSVKGFIKNILPSKLRNNFVYCHPIAGSEQSGFENSDANLFVDKKFIICNQNNHSKKIADLALTIGSNVEFIEAQKHDEIYALISHLPQFLAFLTKEFSPKKIEDDFFKKAFRLNNSAPEIWEEIFKLNKKNLEKFYITFFENLADKMEKLEEGNFNFSLKNNNQITFDEKFFNTSFAEIFFHALVAQSYLEIPQIADFKHLGGNGFLDFTSIIKVLAYNKNELENLIEKNRSKILKIFNSIS